MRKHLNINKPSQTEREGVPILIKKMKEEEEK